jgi:murein DD-endopeptidase MepM/ murein hydrolase activator NlpD
LRSLLTLLLLLAAPAAAQTICSHYLSNVNCIGKNRAIHHGLDFPGDAGTEVISATHGTFVRRTFHECPGHGFFIRTDIRAQHEELEGPVYARYAHVEAHEHLQPGQKIKPGDRLGRIIPLRHTRCYGSREHVHYELRVGQSPKRHIDPHQFWLDGPGKVTCFRDDAAVPPKKTVAPLPCSR